MKMIGIKTKHPKQKYIYAVTGGAYLGELLVYVDKQDNNYSFLSLPQMQNRLIPTEKFDFGLQEQIVEIVEKLPRSVFSTCQKQHAKNIATSAVLA